MAIAGVFSAEGEDWKRQRRVTAHALDANHLLQFFPTIKATERLRNRCAELLSTRYVGTAGALSALPSVCPLPTHQRQKRTIVRVSQLPKAITLACEFGALAHRRL